MECMREEEECLRSLQGGGNSQSQDERIKQVIFNINIIVIIIIIIVVFMIYEFFYCPAFYILFHRVLKIPAYESHKEVKGL